MYLCNSVRWRTEKSLEFEILLQGNPSSCPTLTCTKEATDTVRNDHAQIPRLAPGLNVADPRVSLEIAQVQAGSASLNLVLMAPFFWEERCKFQEISSTHNVSVPRGASLSHRMKQSFRLSQTHSNPKMFIELLACPQSLQVSALKFSGLTQYRQFWDNFRSGVELISASATSEAPFYNMLPTFKLAMGFWR